MDFSHYNLDTLADTGVGELGEGIVYNVADVMGVSLNAKPSFGELLGLLRATSTKTLTDQVTLGGHATREDAVMALTDSWLMRSGILEPLSGAFVNTDIPLPAVQSGVTKTPYNAVRLFVTGRSKGKLDQLTNFIDGVGPNLGSFGVKIITNSETLARGNSDDALVSGADADPNLADYANTILREKLTVNCEKIEIHSAANVYDDIPDALIRKLIREFTFSEGITVVVEEAGFGVMRAAQLRATIRRLQYDRIFDQTTSGRISQEKQVPVEPSPPQLYVLSPGILAGEKPEDIGIRTLEDKTRMIRQMLRTAVALEKAYPKL